MTDTPALLETLLSTPAPSGYEAPASAVWREAASFAEIETDGIGSTIATIGEDDARPLVAVFGHIDEIGLNVTHIDEKGFVYFGPVGGWDPQILVGQRVAIETRDGTVLGVVGARRSTSSTRTSARRRSSSRASTSTSAPRTATAPRSWCGSATRP